MLGDGLGTGRRVHRGQRYRPAELLGREAAIRKRRGIGPVFVFAIDCNNPISAKDDPRLPLLERQQQDLYREAVQRSGRPWKAIAGKAIKRPKTFKNDSSSSSAPLKPTSEESIRTHSPLMKAHASPGIQRAGMPSQSTNFGSTLTIWGSGRQNAPRPADQVAAKLAEALEGAFLIEPGQPGISRYVGGQDGGKLERSEERRVGKECRSRWSPYH